MHSAKPAPIVRPVTGGRNLLLAEADMLADVNVVMPTAEMRQQQQQQQLQHVAVATNA